MERNLITLAYDISAMNAQDNEHCSLRDLTAAKQQHETFNILHSVITKALTCPHVKREFSVLVQRSNFGQMPFLTAPITHMMDSRK